jgi:hypothetical protein
MREPFGMARYGHAICRPSAALREFRVPANEMKGEAREQGEKTKKETKEILSMCDAKV